jgi:hypothetical protein
LQFTLSSHIVLLCHFPPISPTSSLTFLVASIFSALCCSWPRSPQPHLGTLEPLELHTRPSPRPPTCLLEMYTTCCRLRTSPQCALCLLFCIPWIKAIFVSRP